MSIQKVIVNIYIQIPMYANSVLLFAYINETRVPVLRPRSLFAILPSRSETNERYLIRNQSPISRS